MVEPSPTPTTKDHEMSELDPQAVRAAAFAILNNLHNRELDRGAIPTRALTLDDVTAPLMWDAEAAIKAYLAASPPAQEQGWQPIATAPKDETEVLLFCPSLDAPYWMALSQDSNHFPADSGRVVGRYYDGAWVSHAGESGWEDSVTPICLMPTHWRPLPAAPIPGGEE